MKKKILKLSSKDVRILLGALDTYSNHLYNSALSSYCHCDIDEEAALLSLRNYCNDLYIKINNL